MGRLRSSVWAAGAPLRWIMVGMIRLYQLTLSGWLGGQCRFYPSCSHYAERAIRVHGALKGGWMSAWRVARCGPFTDGGVDHVPPPRPPRESMYEPVIQGRVT